MPTLSIAECGAGHSTNEWCATHNSTAGFCKVEQFLEASEAPTRLVFLNNYMLTFGLLCVLSYHLQHFYNDHVGGNAPERSSSSRSTSSSRIGDGRFDSELRWGNSFVRTFGRNIVVLNLYYNKGAWLCAGDNPFVFSLLFIFFDVFVLRNLCRGLARGYREVSDKGLQGLRNFCQGLTALNDISYAADKDSLCIKTRYPDFSSSIGHASGLFFAQFCLFLMFVLSMNEDEDTHSPCNVIIFQWVVGVAVTNVTGYEEAGSQFDITVWNALRREITQEYKDEFWALWRMRMRFYLRMMFDFVINSFCREALLGLAPVLLSVSERMDFVKDCLAIFFIARMDDLPDAKTVEECLKEWWESTRRKDTPAPTQKIATVENDNLEDALQDARVPLKEGQEDA